MRDSIGLELSTDDAAAVAALDRFRVQLLSLGPGVGDIVAAAAAHPDQALVQCCAASLGLYGQNVAADRDAEGYLAAARAAAPRATVRERAHLAALEDWAGRRYEDATAKLEGIVAKWPRDLVAAKTLEFLYFVRGQHYSAARFLKAMQGIAGANPESGYFLSMLSFALELAGRYDEALAAADRAVALEPDNPWAHHTMAHAYLKTGAIAKGRAVLEGYEPIWRAGGPVVHSHNFWHLALMHLEDLEPDAAYRFLHRPILADSPHITVQMVDAISLLWRLEMAGYGVPSGDWDFLAAAVADDAAQAYTAFNSAHFVYALARAGRENALAEALAGLRGAAGAMRGPERAVWQEVGLPLIEGCVAAARGQHDEAARRLGPLMTPGGETVVRGGGSDAQVDLFRQAFLTSLIHAGERSAARACLDRLSTGPAGTPLQRYWRGLC
jgi:tetratricopeptide (TPR) repeat protein